MTTFIDDDNDDRQILILDAMIKNKEKKEKKKTSEMNVNVILAYRCANATTAAYCLN